MQWARYSKDIEKLPVMSQTSVWTIQTYHFYAILIWLYGLLYKNCICGKWTGGIRMNARTKKTVSNEDHAKCNNLNKFTFQKTVLLNTVHCLVAVLPYSFLYSDSSSNSFEKRFVIQNWKIICLVHLSFVYFFVGLEFVGHTCLCRPFCVFGRCLYSNLRSFRCKLASYQLSHLSP